MDRPPDIDTPWMGLEPGDVAGLFEALGLRWWIAGGWAVELAVGRAVRAHADLDVAVPRNQAYLLTALSLAEWQLFVAHEGTLTPWDGGSLEAPRHQFWVREPGGGRWAFEVLLEDIDATQWRYRRDPSVTLPAVDFGATAATPRGAIPHVAPAVALLYKSPAPGERDEVDFEAARGLLDTRARAWLRDALRGVRVDHPWIARL